MVGVQAVTLRHDFHQLHLDIERRLADRKAGAVDDAEDVCVDGDGRFAESVVENQGLLVLAALGHCPSTLRMTMAENLAYGYA